MALRTAKEIKEQLWKARDWSIADKTNYDSFSYEHGVEDALRWVLGQSDDEPIKEEYREGEE